MVFEGNRRTRPPDEFFPLGFAVYRQAGLVVDMSVVVLLQSDPVEESIA